MKCPRCESLVLDERERDGVTVDICPQCRGVWLDRGELERLIARASDEQEAYERPGTRYRDSRSHEHHHDDDDHHHGSRGHGRKRSWLDIFD